MKYVITRRKGPWAGRTMPVELLGKSAWFDGTREAYDIDAYLVLLARQVETLLAPFGYKEQALYAWLKGRTKRPEQDPAAVGGSANVVQLISWT